MTKEEILKKCVVTEGNVVKLPSGQLSRELYTEVAKALELIGGKWKGGKVAGFVFKEDPTEYLEEISQGIKRNVKKEYQFYGTPDSLADKLVDIAELRYLANYKTKTNISILEPSAGQGAIVRAINRILPSQEVDCYELMPLNRKFLQKIPTVNLIGEDFLSSSDKKKYDVIIANPPFSKNQDITHVRKMYEHLKPNGVLVAIMSSHWQHTNNKVERDFRAWLDNLSAEVQTVASGEFKESGTMVQSVIVSFRKIENEAVELVASTQVEELERQAWIYIDELKQQYSLISQRPKNEVIEDVLKNVPSIRKEITYEQALPILRHQMKSDIDVLTSIATPSHKRPKQKLFVSKLIGLQIKLLTFEYE